MVAGVIYAENALNVNGLDTLTDWLGFYGLDSSVGLGQVKMSTAKFIEDQGYINKADETEGAWHVPLVGDVHGSTRMAREKRLENDKINTYYVAAYLKYFQDKWMDAFPEITQRPDILGTLYNLGHQTTHPNSDPKSRPFGDYVSLNYDKMAELLGPN
jgi:hypothetical protein